MPFVAWLSSKPSQSIEHDTCKLRNNSKRARVYALMIRAHSCACPIHWWRNRPFPGWLTTSDGWHVVGGRQNVGEKLNCVKRCDSIVHIQHSRNFKWLKKITGHDWLLCIHKLTTLFNVCVTLFKNCCYLFLICMMAFQSSSRLGWQKLGLWREGLCRPFTMLWWLVRYSVYNIAKFQRAACKHKE